MIGRFDITPPPIDDSLSQMVESHRAKTGQDYGAILFFGLWGTVDCSTEVRLYAAYRHLDAHPEDGPAWLETSRVHLEAGEFAAAEAILDELVRLGNPGLYPQVFSEDPEAHRVYILAESGESGRALAAADDLRAKHGESPVFNYLVGSILQAMGDFDGADAAYAEAEEALSRFREELAAEDMEEESDVDFEAAAGFIAEARRRAAAGQRFDIERPLDLSGFREE